MSVPDLTLISPNKYTLIHLLSEKQPTSLTNDSIDLFKGLKEVFFYKIFDKQILKLNIWLRRNIVNYNQALPPCRGSRIL